VLRGAVGSEVGREVVELRLSPGLSLNYLAKIALVPYHLIPFSGLNNLRRDVGGRSLCLWHIFCSGHASDSV